MDDSIKKLSTTLRSNGFSTTKTRIAVFKALYGEEPQSMHDIIIKLENNVDRASVYRTIDLFETLGIVHRLHVGWKYKIELSDSFHSHHHHINCTSCGLLIPLPVDTAIEESVENISKEYGFTHTSHQIEIKGICPKCNTI